MPPVLARRRLQVRINTAKRIAFVVLEDTSQLAAAVEALNGKTTLPGGKGPVKARSGAPSPAQPGFRPVASRAAIENHT